MYMYIYMISFDFPDYWTYAIVFCYGHFFIGVMFNMVDDHLVFCLLFNMATKS